MSSKHRARVFVGACVAALAVATSAVPSMAAGKTIRTTEDRTFSPAAATVARGTRVTWRNLTDDRHNVVGYGNWSMSATLDEGGSTARTFRKTGTFRYRCTLHSALNSGKCTGMCGKIVVR